MRSDFVFDVYLPRPSPLRPPRVVRVSQPAYSLAAARMYVRWQFPRAVRIVRVQS